METTAGKYLIVRFWHAARLGGKSGADKLPKYYAETLQKIHHPPSGAKDNEGD